MANLNKVNIPIATPSSSRLDLSCDHITTMNFGELQPVHYRHPIKGEHLNLQGAGTIRPFPMPCPTFGRMRCNIHHFYVPWRIVFPQWDSFYNDTIAVNANNASLVPNAPYFTNAILVDWLIHTMTVGGTRRYVELLTFASGSNPPAYDFYDGTNYYKFTSLGKYIYKILVGLGYAINFDSKDNCQYSALPLLALGKIYIDYYANQSYMDSAGVIAAKKLLAYNDPVTPLSLGVADIEAICNLIGEVQYQQDYFVGSWDNPFAPNPNNFSAITFSDITNVSSGTSNVVSLSQNNTAFQSGGVPTMVQGVATSRYIGTEYLHKALKVITDYSKRHQLAGATELNRTLAQFGFGVQAQKLDRAILLDSSSIDVKTGAVFSTANTAQVGETSTLGDYAGNGYGNGVTSFDYKVEEMGIQITLASILPSGGIVQGCDENNMHVNRFQFFTPEFDGLGTQVLRKREVYVSNNAEFGRVDNEVLYDKAFAFTGRYGEYKRPRSWLSGDFRVPSRFAGANAWNLFRLFEDDSFDNSVSNLVHSLEFTKYHDKESYKRVFSVTNSDNDPFYAEFHWNVGSFAPCRGLFETYEFDSDSNKNVTFESNGAIVN